jgi:hypothetical protein
MLHAVVNKFTHPILKQLRESDDGPSAYLQAWRKIYRRDQEK